MSTDEKRERLESPSGELKMLRKQLLIEKLMNKKPELEDSASGNSSENGGDSLRKGFKLGPSSVLSRVKDFLPQMKSANDQLSRLADPSSVSVEAEITEDEEGSGVSFIEMNLAFMPPTEDSSADESVSSDSEDEENNSGGSSPSKPNGKQLISELEN